MEQEIYLHFGIMSMVNYTSVSSSITIHNTVFTIETIIRDVFVIIGEVLRQNVILKETMCHKLDVTGKILG